MQSSKYVSENFFELICLSLKIFECGLSIANYSIVRQMLDERIQVIDPHVKTLEFIDHIFIKFKSISREQQQENFQLYNIDPESIIKILDRCNQMKNSITNTERQVLQQRQETLDYQEILWCYLIQLKLNLINNIEFQNESPENDNVGRFPIPITQNYQFHTKKYDPFFSKIVQLLQNNFLESQKLFNPFSENNFQIQIDKLKNYYWLTFTYLLSFQLLNIHQQLVFFECSIQAFKSVNFEGWGPLLSLLSSSNCWFLNYEMVNEDIINPRLQFLFVLKLNQLINTIDTMNYNSNQQNNHTIRFQMDWLNSQVGGQYIRNDSDYEKIFDKALNLQKYYQRCQVPEEFIDNLIFDTYQTNLRNYQLRLQIEDRVEFIRQEIQKIMDLSKNLYYLNKYVQNFQKFQVLMQYKESIYHSQSLS